MAISDGQRSVSRYESKLKAYLRRRNAPEPVTIRKMWRLSSDQFIRLLSGVTAQSRLTRLKTGLKYFDMLWTTLKWFKMKKIPDWPV